MGLRKNKVNPYTIAPKTKGYIWIKCKNDKSHDSFKTKAIDYNINKKCPTCIKVISESKPKFGEIHSDIIKQVWDYEKIK